MRDLVQYGELSRPTVHRILGALCQEGMVAHDPHLKRYMIGPTAFELGLVARKPFWALHKFRPLLAKLTSYSGDTIYLMTTNGYEIICLERLDGTFPVRAHSYDIGSRTPLGGGSSSILFLSMLPDTEIEDILAFNSYSLREYGYASLTPIREAIQRYRETGLAVMNNIAGDGVVAMSALVPNSDSESYLAVTIAAIATRMSDERITQLQPRLEKTAREIGELCAFAGSGRVGI